ncbi:MAG TPA: indole-3-glycerol phosphate synthase TrpC [Aggregatilineales bacterium]|nr:indole-3-glycerol phosphate synthase TrpC [Aggregatilineales bacterium]
MTIRGDWHHEHLFAENDIMNGVVRTDTVLDKIIAHKRGEIDEAVASRSLESIKAECETLPPTRDFLKALQKDTVALIAEVKHASPSKGILIEPFDPVALAKEYAENGASAISILTDEQFFQGHLDYLGQIREVVKLPLLRKEFIISPYQVYEARAAGADALLLIVATLEDSLLIDLHTLANELGLAVLVEVHYEHEMERALHFDAPLIGVNNRDLRDFSVDLAITRRLASMIPYHTVLVGESGIKTPDDVQNLGGVNAILVGETVVTAENRPAKLHELSGVPRQKRNNEHG